MPFPTFEKATRTSSVPYLRETGFVFAVYVIALAGLMGYDAYRFFVSAKGWVDTQAGIVSLAPRRYGVNARSFILRYPFNGGTYEARHSLDSELLARYKALRVGEDSLSIRVPLRVNPADPAESVPNPSGLLLNRLMLLGIGSALFAGWWGLMRLWPAYGNRSTSRT